MVNFWVNINIYVSTSFGFARGKCVPILCKEREMCADFVQ